MKRSKKEMSITIATVLLNAKTELNESNWKVQDLMKRTVAELKDAYKLACQIQRETSLLIPCKNDQGCFLRK